MKHTELAVEAWRAWVKDKPFQSEDTAKGFIAGFNFCLNGKIADYENKIQEAKKQLTKVKEFLITYKDFLEYEGLTTRLGNLYDRTVRFLKEIEK